MAFRFTLSSQDSIRLLYRSFYCCSKIGDEVHLEPTVFPDTKLVQLTVRTLNQSRSAHIIFVFKRAMFEAAEAPSQFDDGHPIPNFKVNLKSLLHVFSGSHFNQISSLTFLMQIQGSDYLDVVVDCNPHSMRKEFKLVVEDQESLKAQYDFDRNNVCIFNDESRHLVELLSNLGGKCERVGFRASNEGELSIRSAWEEEDEANAVSTSVIVRKSDLLDFRFKPDGPPHCEIGKNFQLREAKAFLGFCEIFNLKVKVVFSKGNGPIMFEATSPNESTQPWAADLLIAAWDEAPAEPQPAGSDVRGSSDFGSIRSDQIRSAAHSPPPPQPSFQPSLQPSSPQPASRPQQPVAPPPAPFVQPSAQPSPQPSPQPSFPPPPSFQVQPSIDQTGPTTSQGPSSRQSQVSPVVLDTSPAVSDQADSFPSDLSTLNGGSPRFEFRQSYGSSISSHRVAETPLSSMPSNRPQEEERVSASPVSSGINLDTPLSAPQASMSLPREAVEMPGVTDHFRGANPELLDDEEEFMECYIEPSLSQ